MDAAAEQRNRMAAVTVVVCRRLWADGGRRVVLAVELTVAVALVLAFAMAVETGRGRRVMVTAHRPHYCNAAHGVWAAVA